MASKSIKIDVLHPLRSTPVETISRTPTTADNGDMVVNYNGKQFSVLDLGGKNVIYSNRPRGSKYKARQPAMA